jgi:hypothetical protein
MRTGDWSGKPGPCAFFSRIPYGRTAFITFLVKKEANSSFFCTKIIRLVLYYDYLIILRKNACELF